MMRMRFFMLCGLCLVAGHVSAAQPRESWSLAWDAHPQASKISYYLLQIDQGSSVYKTQQIVGGGSTVVSGVTIPASLPGVFTAVVRACDSNNACSTNSNRVTFDRTSPEAPVWLKYTQ